MKTRCIVYSSENGSREGVYFTTDHEADSDYFIPIGCTVDHDFVIEGYMPDSFPFDYNLER